MEKFSETDGLAYLYLVERKTTRISGADFPHEIVRSRFLKLDSSHIEFVMAGPWAAQRGIRGRAGLFAGGGQGRAGQERPACIGPCLLYTSPKLHSRSTRRSAALSVVNRYSGVSYTHLDVYKRQLYTGYTPVSVLVRRDEVHGKILFLSLIHI